MLKSTGAAYPKRRRLLRRSDYVLAQRCGSGVHSRSFVLLCHLRTPSNDACADEPRLGVVASRKMGNAVLRNRAKRRVREWFRQLFANDSPNLRLDPAEDIVVILRRSAATCTAPELTAELDRALPRAQRKARNAAVTNS